MSTEHEPGDAELDAQADAALRIFCELAGSHRDLPTDIDDCGRVVATCRWCGYQENRGPPDHG